MLSPTLSPSGLAELHLHFQTFRLHHLFLLPARGMASSLVAAGPRSRHHQLPETIPCPWAVYLGVPLLAVQAHLHTLTDEETHPHDDIADRALSLVVHGEVECHSKDGKEQEHDGVEEAEPHGQSILVDDGRDDENREHGSSSEFPI